MSKRWLVIVFTAICSLSPISFSKGTEDLIFTSQEISIYYTDSGGQGTPVVLLHGFGMSQNMWFDTGIAQALEPDYRVITLDLRGHGKSDKPTQMQSYGPKMGEDVVNLLTHIEIEKAHMIGYSMGAFIVGRLLVTHPDRIISATLGSGSFPVTNEQEMLFQESTAKDMEEHGNIALANVARGWSLDTVTEEQISQVGTPIQGVFGSEEKGEFIELQLKLLKMPKNSRPVLVIEGADHGSRKAAILHPKFLGSAKSLIDSAEGLLLGGHK